MTFDACNDTNGYRAVDDGRTAEYRSSVGPLARAGRRTIRLGRAFSFWAAVVLPFVAVALVATGLSSIDRWVLLLAVLLLDGVSLYVGHPYCQST